MQRQKRDCSEICTQSMIGGASGGEITWGVGRSQIRGELPAVLNFRTRIQCALEFDDQSKLSVTSRSSATSCSRAGAVSSYKMDAGAVAQSREHDNFWHWNLFRVISPAGKRSWTKFYTWAHDWLFLVVSPLFTSPPPSSKLAPVHSRPHIPPSFHRYSDFFPICNLNGGW